MSTVGCGFKMPTEREVIQHKERYKNIRLPDSTVFWITPVNIRKASDVYSLLPERGKKIPFLAVETHDGSYTHEKILRDKYLGYCDWKGKILYMRWSPMTFAHEWFHLIQVYSVTSKEWQAIEAWWKLNKGRGPSRGKKSSSEWWAEVGAMAYLNPEDLHPDDTAFIRGIMGDATQKQT